MRRDFVALVQEIWALVSLSLVKLAAGGAVLLTMLSFVYLVWPSSQAAPMAHVVTANAAVFTPVAMTPPPERAARVPAASAADRPAPADDGRSAIRAMQSHLKRAGCYGGPLDGRWTPATRRAMAAFTERVNARLPVDEADPVLLVLLETHETAACDAAPVDLPVQETPRFAVRDAAFLTTAAAAPIPIREETVLADTPGTEAMETGVVEAEGKAVAFEPLSEAAPSIKRDRRHKAKSARARAKAAAAKRHRKIARAERARANARRAYRKKVSFSRSVSYGFRRIQRGFFVW
mgnify:CR=1 FL=1